MNKKNKSITVVISDLDDTLVADSPFFKRGIDMESVEFSNMVENAPVTDACEKIKSFIKVAKEVHYVSGRYPFHEKSTISWLLKQGLWNEDIMKISLIGFGNRERYTTTKVKVIEDYVKEVTKKYDNIKIYIFDDDKNVLEILVEKMRELTNIDIYAVFSCKDIVPMSR
jgi:predicted secreted acid phosphatase